ncbi:type II toxin-antitoxin system prevent-host-death family antitoxin [Enterococcus pseudoavium]|uniref:Type II toxin-antitoxin system prevent-host-death family antitoxin n=1 Tax=Enterococcus pseudoavium TaxID=44007 RepID=A0AAE4I104_9ENTE|nr:type II toxin-antitoxin system prevent-host-death family antitoxin [Enterococcus pseudoavium]MDT2735806.1 type II toxin-antitoxin system prevent-host-death family antitoxin [Enterococcus pseudoavium]
MENILPVSDMRFYNKALSSIDEGNQVILTKNGRPKYVVADYTEWTKMNATIELFTELQKGVQSFETETPLTLDQLKSRTASKAHDE